MVMGIAVQQYIVMGITTAVAIAVNGTKKCYCRVGVGWVCCVW